MKRNKQELDHLATAIAGTRRNLRSLRVDRVSTAESLKALREIYGSTERVAAKVTISAEMVREFLCLLRLSPEAMEYWKSGRVASVDIGYRISTRVPRELQAAMADLVVQHNLTTKEVDAVTAFIKHHPGLSPQEAADRVMKSMDKVVYVAEYCFKPSVADECRRTGFSQEELWRHVQAALKELAGPKNIVECKLQGRVLRIKVNRAGLSRLRDAAKGAGVVLRDLATQIARKVLKSCPGKHRPR
jgi:hypothetical protein